MKPCDLCGQRHESYQAHVFTKEAARRVVNAVVNKSDLPPHVVNVPEPKPETRTVRRDEPAFEVVVVRNRDRHKDKEARKVYMREYMRKRRAK